MLKNKELTQCKTPEGAHNIIEPRVNDTYSFFMFVIIIIYFSIARAEIQTIKRPSHAKTTGAIDINQRVELYDCINVGYPMLTSLHVVGYIFY